MAFAKGIQFTKLLLSSCKYGTTILHHPTSSSTTNIFIYLIKYKIHEEKNYEMRKDDIIRGKKSSS